MMLKIIKQDHRLEKEGGRPRSQLCMGRFRETLEHCQLHDLGYEGEITTMLQMVI
jgi:hypothetical protein